MSKARLPDYCSTRPQAMAQLTRVLLLLTAATAPVAAAATCPAYMCGAQESQSVVCPTATSARSDPVLALEPHNLYIRNAASHSAEIFYVQKDGSEVSHGLLTPGGRRSFAALHGDVWRARAVSPGKVGNGALMLEHQVSAVEVRNCECPQPEFNDVSERVTLLMFEALALSSLVRFWRMPFRFLCQPCT
eukprot:5430226-Pleurochrysis_carterae.AAC.3